jgi:hypothetical protein
MRAALNDAAAWGLLKLLDTVRVAVRVTVRVVRAVLRTNRQGAPCARVATNINATHSHPVVHLFIRTSLNQEHNKPWAAKHTAFRQTLTDVHINMTRLWDTI